MATFPTRVMDFLLNLAPASTPFYMETMHDEFVGVVGTRLGRGEAAARQFVGWGISLGKLPPPPVLTPALTMLLDALGHGRTTIVPTPSLAPATLARRQFWTLGGRALRREWTRGTPRLPYRSSNTRIGWLPSAAGMAPPQGPLLSPGSTHCDGVSPPGAPPFSAAPPTWRPTMATPATATPARPPPAPTLLREPRNTASLLGLAMRLIA